MSWNLRLNPIGHDLNIGTDGKFLRVTGSDEVAQRVKVTLWHYLGEWFLDITKGVPYYEDILGRKNQAATVNSIIRREILRVPGVLRLFRFFSNFQTITRRYNIEASIRVQLGPDEQQTIIPVSTVVGTPNNLFG